MSKEWEIPNCETIPVIALRGLTVFPNVLIHFDVAREISIKALEAAMKSGQPIPFWHRILVGLPSEKEHRDWQAVLLPAVYLGNRPIVVVSEPREFLPSI